MRKHINWLSHDQQNEILKIMARNVLRGMLTDVKQNEYLFLIHGERTDIGTKDQLCTYQRHVDTNLQINEDFIGIYEK